MAKTKTYYVCTECGFRSTRWIGNCPSCKKWNTLEEITETPANVSIEHKSRLSGLVSAPPLKLTEIEFKDERRVSTGISEFDRVLGDGFMPGSFVLLGGDPGVGKSTLALQIARARPAMNILYCSGEESATQIKQRSLRLGLNQSAIRIYTETDVNRIIEQVRQQKPELLVIDSIQTVYRPELQGMPGTVAQIRECTGLLIQLAKQEQVTTLAIGHVTKDGDLAGPRIMEHMVDAVLQFEGDKNYQYRLLRSLKNRFGSVNEIGVFEMKGEGLEEVTNPSLLFLSDYDANVSGNAVVCTLEGTRPILLEVQALVTKSNYGMPQRTANAFDQRRLSLLLAVLEKRCGFELSGQDVFLNITGGMKLDETACDAGIVAAIISSLLDKSLMKKIAFIGEVGLGAEVRAVNKIEQRVNEINKMGFDTVIVPKANNYRNKAQNLNVIAVSGVADILNKIFR